MKSTDRSILLGLLILGLGAAFWFLVLSPKREEAAELQTQIDAIQAEVQTQEATIAQAEEARDDYEPNYRTVVNLGKAVPSEADAPSLLTQFQALADSADVEFLSLELAQDGTAQPAAAPEQTTTDQNLDSASGDETETPAAAPATPTEATAATLPLGAGVGPAGLPVMPYNLLFTGDFFEMADYLASLDRLVDEGKAALDVSGRLITVNGFTIAPPAGSSDASALEMKLSLNTYVNPATEGLTNGATPAAPPITGAEPTPVAAGTETP